MEYSRDVPSIILSFEKINTQYMVPTLQKRMTKKKRKKETGDGDWEPTWFAGAGVEAASPGVLQRHVFPSASPHYKTYKNEGMRAARRLRNMHGSTVAES